MTTTDFTHLLGSIVIFDGGVAYRLERLLGGGATAVVFEGVNLNSNKKVAIKVARFEAQWQEALKREWHNLYDLSKAQKSRAVHYFPYLLHPAGESGLPQPIAGQTYLVLAQELVAGQGVHDLLLEYPSLRLPEPLALEIGCQYAKMLTILHSINLTCADRKLPDLRWHKAYDIRPENPAGLVKWAETLPGQLIILDWNVTGTATSSEVALDLFRFGLLWHRLLLGVEPRFRSGTGWQLEEPLAKHPAWPTLSFGTRQILEQLLHPMPEQRYHNAQTLWQNLQVQRKYWQTEANTLIGSIEPTYRHWIEKKAPTTDAVNNALAMADTLRVRVESWGERRPDSFDSIYRALRRAVFDAPFSALRSACNMRQWDEANKAINNLEIVYTDNPACRLYLERQRSIVNLARQSGAADAAKSLVDQSELIFLFDRPPDEPDSQGDKLDDNCLAEWKKARDNESNPDWRHLRTALVNAGDYRLNLERARTRRDDGDYPAAVKLFDHLMAIRAGWQEKKALVGWLDWLYGDPIDEYSTVKRILRAGQNAQDILQQALQAIKDGPIETDEQGQETGANLGGIVEKVRNILRTQPNPLFGRLSLLLAAAQAYHQVKSTNTSLRLYHLKQLDRGWQELLNVSHDQPISPAGVSINNEQEQLINEFLRQQRQEITTWVIDQLTALTQLEPEQAAAGTIPLSEGIDHLPVVLLIQAYQGYFPSDVNFENRLETFFQMIQQPLKTFLQETPGDGFNRYEQRLNRYIQVAGLAEAVAKAIGLNWPTYTEQLQQKLQNERGHLEEAQRQAEEERKKEKARILRVAQLNDDFLNAQ